MLHKGLPFKTLTQMFQAKRLTGPCAKGLVKPGFTRVQAWLNQPDFSGFQTRLTRLYHNQGIPGNPGYPKNQENQTLTRLLKF